MVRDREEASRLLLDRITRKEKGFMKNSRQCPKCGNMDVFIVNGYTSGHGSGNNIEVGMSVFSAVPVDRYVCSQCGYSEEWIRVEDISKLRKSRHAEEMDRARD